MARRALTDDEITRQIPAARARAAGERRSGLRAVSARYDRSRERIVLELANGYLFAIPVSALPHLAKATPKQRAAVEVRSSGSAIRFEEIDADYSVAALLVSSLGDRQARSELARLAGRTTSAAKARAARENGSRGGRPRKS